jgi:signal transduction histidine kinase/DNA-binding response OmpR family regulator
MSSTSETTTARERRAPPPFFLEGGGEMGALMRSQRWQDSVLGAPAQWPQSLRTAVSICLHSRLPMLIWWGPRLAMLYNDAYREIIGARHPASLGKEGADCWRELWDVIGPLLASVVERREATRSDDQLLMLERNGFPEECYFTFSYSPIFDESGGVGGVFTAVTETTGSIVSQRRIETLRRLATQLADVREPDDAYRRAAFALGENPRDLPWLRLEAIDDALAAPRRVAASGEAPDALERLASSDASLDPLAQAMESARRDGVAQSFALARDSREVVVVQPVRVSFRADPAALLVAGLHPERIDDAAYRAFVALVAVALGGALDKAHSREVERRRAEALAEIDRAKTIFFSSVSHELRTPLTLIIGPLEELLESRAGSEEAPVLASAHRNALRLRQLVDTLLDFARIDAGSYPAQREPTDLAAATLEIAVLFRSAIEGAGLRFTVDCPELSRAAMVDREMWEKVVVNFLSNACKYTHAGEIAISLHEEDGRAVLRVRDSGVGIAAEHLPRLFERFHRIPGARGRALEGTGTGLALVKELVQRHGGTVGVESRPGAGSTFSVSIPLDASRDDAMRAAPGRPDAPAARERRVHDELERIAALPLPPAAEGAAPQPGELAPRVLVVEDNADMRAYLERLLAPRWRVALANGGREALDALRADPPDVLLTGLMLPDLDGAALLGELRADPALRELPVLVLSARAGEEARAEGLALGADDYLVKPFAARELLARLDRQLLRVRERALEASVGRRLATVFEHAPVGIALLEGPAHRYSFVNPDYRRLVPGRELIGRTVREEFPELEGQGLLAALDRVYATGEPYVVRALPVDLLDAVSGRMEPRRFDFVYQPLPGPDGASTGIAVVAYDVNDLVQARRDAEDASRTKDQFIAMLGHELRNPLAPILTALHLMRMRAPEVATKERGIIERQVQHLVRLIDDLLDVSRIARGNIQLKRQPLEIWGVVAKAIETASPLIEQRGHVLTTRVPAQGLVVDGDALRLTQVLANLLINAAKFTAPQGRIAIEAERRDGRLALSVIDNGVGMDPGEIDAAFRLFAQGPQAADRPHGGLGLGLAIAQSLARLHGGELLAQSAGRGQGSRFVVLLPLAGQPGDGAAPRGAGEGDAGAAASGRAVLVVDDNADAAAMLAELLGAWGHRARVAHDGPSALSLLREAQVDVALLDIGLPVMDGYELAEQIRREPRWRAMRLVALTGYGQDSDRRRSRDAGFDAHLVKPVDTQALRELLES